VRTTVIPLDARRLGKSSSKPCSELRPRALGICIGGRRMDSGARDNGRALLHGDICGSACACGKTLPAYCSPIGAGLPLAVALWGHPMLSTRTDFCPLSIGIGLVGRLPGAGFRRRLVMAWTVPSSSSAPSTVRGCGDGEVDRRERLEAWREQGSLVRARPSNHLVDAH